MRTRNDLKLRVQKLRSHGKTYSEIQKILHTKFPKSTLSHWCHHVILPKHYMEKVDQLNVANLNKAQKMAWVSNKIKHEKFLQEIWRKNQHLIQKLKDRDTLKIALAMLYLGEGSKWTSRRGLSLGSSDPNIIQLYLYLLKTCYNINSEMLGCRISYRADQDIRSLEKYWSKLTSIPLRNFYKTKPDPRTIGKPTIKSDYKGVCVISGGGTHIQLELDAIPKILRGCSSVG